ncbi:glycosyl transferase family 2 [Thermodesulfatator indicus DSM 15286]|uniref:Glycosyl transferase family 2 n=1 Tax=Thermodesulfatator indicus (strain DSM 15286 / JCM 11887 / CIR29812) TaxID=667014 RepID=F8ADP1_THEID|nr:glycosyltransferase family 2 protein [Thermodesulfatator indicus]AEH45999.1 glycosyl transferase family 2 [Thermodesulfatator indicus DSM 15286]
MEKADAPYLSIVIPVFNEEENIPLLLENIEKALKNFKKAFEVIIVDDGSTDNSLKILKELKPKYPWLKIVALRRNFGQSAAFTAGIDHAKGKVIVTMDGDLQNDPRDIPKLLEKIEEGYDVVSGWRKDRKDPFISRRLPSMMANALISRFTHVKLHDYGCSLKAYRAEVIKGVTIYGELHRFIPALVGLSGARVAEVEVTHHPRRYGRSKYGISRTYRVILDLLLMIFFRKFATKPLHIFGLTGGTLFLLGLGIELYLSFLKIFMGQDIGQRPLLILGVLLILTGINLLGTGLLAELVIRTYYESSGKRIYSVREVIE